MSGQHQGGWLNRLIANHKVLDLRPSRLVRCLVDGARGFGYKARLVPLLTTDWRTIEQQGLGCQGCGRTRESERKPTPLCRLHTCVPSSSMSPNAKPITPRTEREN